MLKLFQAALGLNDWRLANIWWLALGVDWGALQHFSTGTRTIEISRHLYEQPWAQKPTSFLESRAPA